LLQAAVADHAENLARLVLLLHATSKRAYIVSIESFIRNSLIGAIHHINYLRGT